MCEQRSSLFIRCFLTGDGCKISHVSLSVELGYFTLKPLLKKLLGLMFNTCCVEFFINGKSETPVP